MLNDLVVGAVGGAAAGVIIALATHLLQARQRREQRKESRHSSLRQMLETHWRIAHRAESGSFRIHVWIQTGMDPRSAYYKYLEEEREDLPKAAGDFMWQPHRIDDIQLRDLATQLNDKHFEAEMALQQVTSLPLSDWQNLINAIFAEMRHLAQEIDSRLDQLEWQALLSPRTSHL